MSLSKNLSTVFFGIVFVLTIVFVFLINTDKEVYGLTGPTSLSASITNTTATLTWTASADTNVTGYEIQYCKGSSCTPSTSVNVSGRTTATKTISSLTASSTYRFRIRAVNSNGGIPTGNWSSADKPSYVGNARVSLIDAENDKIWIFDYDDGAYYKSINSIGIPTGNWSSEDEPSGLNNVQGGYIDTDNNKIWIFDYYNGAYYKALDSNGVPTGSWSSADEPSGAGNVEGGYIDTTNNKLWIFDELDGAYYKSINSSGVPTGSWSSADEPSGAGRVRIGYIDTTNNKLWIFDQFDGAYYKSLNSSGVPTGSWSSADKPTGASTGGVYGGYIDTTNNKLWLFDNQRGAYYKSINSSGVPTGSWSSADEPSGASNVYSGFVDTENNNIWITDVYDGVYYKSITGANSAWSSIVSATGLSSLSSPGTVDLDRVDGSITASWTAATDTNATGYELQYCSGASCTPNTSIVIPDKTITSYKIKSDATSSYSFRHKITANSNALDSAWSTTQTTTSADIRLPSVSCSSYSSTSTSIKLNWTAITDTKATGYKVQYCKGSTCTPNTDVVIASRAITTTTIRNLDSYSTYSVRMKATASNSNQDSNWSDILKIKTKLAAPGGLSLNGNVTATTIPIKWSSVTNANGYNASYCGTGTNCADDSVTGWSALTVINRTAEARGLTYSKSYKFRVQAKNTLANDLGDYAVATFSTVSISPPHKLSVKNSSRTGFTPYWIAPSRSNPSSYEVQYCLQQ